MNLLEEIRTRLKIDIEAVEKIELEIGPVASTAAAIKEPKLGVEGKFSVWFLAALALAEGSVTLEKFTDEKVNDPRLVRLRKKIETRLDPRIGFGARLRLIMKDGTEHQAAQELDRGSRALLAGRGATVVNVDATVIAEEPKLAPLREAMCLNIARALRVGAEKVSVKATTNEALGALGRQEGLAALAVAMVELP